MSPLHPDAARLMDMIRLTRRPAMETLTVPEARAIYAAGRLVLQLPPEPVAECRDETIAGPGGALRLRLYRGAGDGRGALLYLHGGGWVIGDLESHDGVCRRLANMAGCWVVAVDYRLAPEHPFPAAIEDAAAALAWLAGQAAVLGFDPAKLAVGGDSAGGNLAAALALMGRDGTAPRSSFQMLFYPVTEMGQDTPSYLQMTQGVTLTAAAMAWFIAHYLQREGDAQDWRAAPALAASVSGTPPAFVLTVAHDPLCDEGRAYAARLEAEGVRVVALHLADQMHGLLTMNKMIAAGDGVLRLAAAAMRDAWRA